jgi:hypothetical protein
MPRKQKLKLRNLKECKKFLADAIIKVESGEMEPQKGNALAYQINILRGIIEGGDIEARLEELENEK